MVEPKVGSMWGVPDLTETWIRVAGIVEGRVRYTELGSSFSRWHDLEYWPPALYGVARGQLFQLRLNVDVRDADIDYVLRWLVQCGSSIIAIPENIRRLATRALGDVQEMSNEQKPIAEWKIIPGYRCAKCLDPYISNCWGCAKCNGETCAIAFNFLSDDGVPSLYGPGLCRAPESLGVPAAILEGGETGSYAGAKMAELTMFGKPIAARPGMVASLPVNTHPDSWIRFEQADGFHWNATIGLILELTRSQKLPAGDFVRDKINPLLEVSGVFVSFHANSVTVIKQGEGVVLTGNQINVDEVLRTALLILQNRSVDSQQLPAGNSRSPFRRTFRIPLATARPLPHVSTVRRSAARAAIMEKDCDQHLFELKELAAKISEAVGDVIRIGPTFVDPERLRLIAIDAQRMKELTAEDYDSF